MTRVMSYLLATTLLMSAGCLRQRWQGEDVGFRDHPALPQQDFGRPAEQHGQAGLDARSRQIESNLGIEGEPRRIFDR